ncbi:hypothetical protein [Pseudodesulfovibrio sediminis]|uniref:Uncharacterized protein n=1 Tax=Pseudodesulfovibrio sediminis TaxID=2810563 RepID=A0ABN6ELG6_9BACT|nr:hypothetical protein [Pseudodesulfovibrio sediminis]BCS86867.1 hypothetical protein PSDVSF_01090 [Pseudodesulfovibrio sediminis]
MQIESMYLIIAIIVSLVVGIMLYLWQRPRLSIPYILVAVGGAILSLYYILNVLFGSGRTGWP